MRDSDRLIVVVGEHEQKAAAFALGHGVPRKTEDRGLEPVENLSGSVRLACGVVAGVEGIATQSGRFVLKQLLVDPVSELIGEETDNDTSEKIIYGDRDRQLHIL